jgi:hypothetical protein
VRVELDVDVTALRTEDEARDGERNRTREEVLVLEKKKGRVGKPNNSMSRRKRRYTCRRPISYQKTGAMSDSTMPRAVHNITKAILKRLSVKRKSTNSRKP